MMALREIELDCPACRLHFASRAVVSTDASGGRRTDFREHAQGAQPLPYLVHMCPRCGYSAVERDFARDVEVSAALRARVWAELEPLARRAPITDSEKYEAAAKVAEWQGLEPRHVADLLLRAAWCCVDEGDVEAERFFRRKAAWAFAKALESWDGVAREERAVLTYLVGELWRRVGDQPLARDWFDRVQGEIVDPMTQRWIVQTAEQQRTAPREWFGGAPPPAALARRDTPSR